jgi:hypothetical protein
MLASERRHHLRAGYRSTLLVSGTCEETVYWPLRFRSFPELDVGLLGLAFASVEVWRVQVIRSVRWLPNGPYHSLISAHIAACFDGVLDTSANLFPSSIVG